MRPAQPRSAQQTCPFLKAQMSFIHSDFLNHPDSRILAELRKGHSKSGSLESLDIRTTSCTTISKLPIDNNCWYRFDAKIPCPAWYSRIIHIKDGYSTRCACIIFDCSNRIVANRASGTEYFNFAFCTQVKFSLTTYYNKTCTLVQVKGENDFFGFL